MTSAVEEVKIFLRGAEIKRRMVMDTTEGENTAVFSGLPQDIRPESVNVLIEKGGTLISADYEEDSFKESNLSGELEALKKKLENVKGQIKETERKQRLLLSEEKFLDVNMKVGGDSGAALKDLKEIEKYYSERKEETSSSLLEADKKMEELKREKDRLEKEMGGSPSNRARYSGKITAEFLSESKGKAEIVVSYYVNSASWKPIHEIRMAEVGAPVSLTMKGSIIQNTGEDWSNVKVKLSTGNPTLGNRQPTLYPWHIDLVMPGKLARNKAFEEMDSVVDANPSADMDFGEGARSAKAASPAQMMAQVEESRTTTEFTLPVPLSIASSDKPRKVEIAKHVLEAETIYYCVSKLDTDAFLIANIKGWESLNLLQGEVSIFQGNEHVGMTYLDPASTEEEMTISLGRDRAIIVTREKGNDVTSRGMIGKNTKVQREWIITVKNTRSKGIKMKLIDQIPISTNSDLVVDAVELSGAELNKETGILTWSLDIPAGGSVKKILRYSATYPKNGTVYLY